MHDRTEPKNLNMKILPFLHNSTGRTTRIFDSFLQSQSLIEKHNDITSIYNSPVIFEESGKNLFCSQFIKLCITWVNHPMGI